MCVVSDLSLGRASQLLHPEGEEGNLYSRSYFSTSGVSMELDVSERMGKKISDYHFTRCIKTIMSKFSISFDETFDIITSFLQSNYSLRVPSIWKVHPIKGQGIDTTLDIFDGMFERDMMNWKKFNIDKPLGKLPTFILRLCTYNVHFWISSVGEESGRSNFDAIMKDINNISPSILALQEAVLPGRSTLMSALYYDGHQEKNQVILNTNIKSDSAQSYRLRSIDTADKIRLPRPISRFVDIGYGYMAEGMSSTTHTATRSGSDSIFRSFFGNVIFSKPQMNVDGVQAYSLNSEVQGRSLVITYYPGILVEGAKWYGLIVATTHLDVFDDTSAVRKRQAAEVVNLVSSFRPIEYVMTEDASQSIPTILMGDFNCLKREDYTETEIEWLKVNNQDQELDFDTIKIFEDAGFVDVFNKLKYSVRTARRVDYMMIRNIPLSAIASTNVHYTAASDHIPLVLDLRTGSPQY